VVVLLRHLPRRLTPLLLLAVGAATLIDWRVAALFYGDSLV
jgi:hypothetical protein